MCRDCRQLTLVETGRLLDINPDRRHGIQRERSQVKSELDRLGESRRRRMARSVDDHQVAAAHP
jgi:hypothetical protein